MSNVGLIIVVAVFCVAGYQLGRRRSLAIVQGNIRKLHSLPSYYGLYVAIACFLPALVILGLWLFFESSVIQAELIATLPPDVQSLNADVLDLRINDIKNVASGRFAAGESDVVIRDAAASYQSLLDRSALLRTLLVTLFSLSFAALAWRRITPTHRARNAVERVMKIGLMSCASVAFFTTIGILLSVLFESLHFFKSVPISDFLFGLHWSPQTPLRPDQVGSSGAFGAVPLFAGTLLISAIAMIVSVPIGLKSAIFLSEFASDRFRSVAKPLLEMLAGIPTVVYGFFAALTVAPFIREVGGFVGLSVASESALAAGLVMGVMIIPFVSSLSDDVIRAVPQSLRDGAYGLGATKAETIRRVVLPAALPGIVSGILLAVSRAIGETMIVVMAAGLSAKLSFNPLEAVTTVTVQIVTLLTGDQEFDSPKTQAAFALALVLFVTTLILNIIALKVVRKYREQYD